LYILPVPKTISALDGHFRITGNLRINPSDGEKCIAASNIVVAALQRTHNLSPQIATEPNPPKRCINLSIADDFKGEGYSLSIRNTGINLKSSSSEGLVHCARTLEQILEQSTFMLPCLDIEDSPDFPNRGFYHDISRGKMPKLETMKLLIEKASRYKLNQFQFYVEHVFAFSKNPKIWEGFDTITPEEVKELDSYALSLGIDLIPSLSSFGHMYEILRNPAYSHLCELDNFTASKDPATMWMDRMVHHTIDVSNEESYTLIEDMFDEYLPLFSSKYFNMCCDETVDLGKGKNKARADKEGVGSLYLGHVLRLYEMAKKHGKQVMIWGDIVVMHPELIPQLPKDIILLNWQYSPTVTEKWSRLFGESNAEFYNCPGIWGWSRFAYDLDRACNNIRSMTAYAKKYGATGILNTDWGDFGHINPLAGAYHGLAFGACISWNAGDTENAYFDKAFSVIEFGDESGKTASLLRELGSLYTLWRGMIRGIGNLKPEDFKLYKLTDEYLAKSCRRSREIAIELAKIRENVRDDRKQDYDEFIWGASAVNLNAQTAMLAKRKRENTLKGLTSKDMEQYSASLRALSDDLEKLWRTRNKESELYRLTAVLESIAKEADNIF
jgi:hypothetical protein